MNSVAAETVNNADSVCIRKVRGKHPVQYSWSFWYNKNQRENAWDSNLFRLGVITTIEEFWTYLHHIPPPDVLEIGGDLNFFKGTVPPMWEAEENAKGGRIMFEFRNTKNINELWQTTLMFIIGDQFGALTECINGIVLTVRRQKYRISIWISNGEDSASVSSISDIYNKLLKSLNEQAVPKFQQFSKFIN